MAAPPVGTVAPGLRPESAQTTIKYGPPPAPAGPTLRTGAEWVLIGVLGMVTYAVLTHHVPSLAPTTGATPTNPNAVEPVPGLTPSGLAPPGTPTELRELGATAHSVIVDCSPVVGATGYRWYLAGTRLPLAFSPTNTAVIEGLQANTAYDVVCAAVAPDGTEGGVSGPLLIRTTTARPQIYVPPNAPNVNVIIRLLQASTGAPPTGAPPAGPVVYPVAFLVSDVADYALARSAGVPAGALYYAGADPYAAIATSADGYLPATFLPPYTGASDQPQQTVVVGLAGQVRYGTLATLEGATRDATNYLLRVWLDANPWAVRPSTT